MSFSSNHPVFLCLDFETTGLDEKCGIVECASVCLDAYFDPTGPVGSTLVEAPGDARVEQQAMEMHTKNGLIEAHTRGDPTVTYQQLDEMLCAQVSTIDKPVIVGNTPTFDRKFIDAHLPKLSKRLHYRSLDVSSLRIAYAAALEMTNPNALKTALGFGSHRAADDVEACVAELAVFFNGMRASVRSPKTNIQLLAKLQEVNG